MKIKITNEHGDIIYKNKKYFYQENKNSGNSRLVVTTNESPIDLMVKLISKFKGDYNYVNTLDHQKSNYFLYNS